MSTSSVHTTAQIIQFPASRRKASAERSWPTAPDLERQAAVIAASEAWYHNDAIEDSKRIGEC